MSDRCLFISDYTDGAHPAILDALAAANPGQHGTYGLDEHSALAAERIRARLGRDADVHLVGGGTQANLVVLSALLRPHEGVIAASDAHINVHETGAVEATGHKIIVVPSGDAKLTPARIDEALRAHEDEHTVKPRIVAVTQATEKGTVYTGAELRAMTDHAHANGLLVYLDGARLAMALPSEASGGMSLRSIADAGVDVLYLGGTKAGALLGEAICVVNPGLRADFRYLLKQRGALLAKGWVLGAQFARFFDDDDLWISLGTAANAHASRLASGLRGAGIELEQDPQVNQVFALMRRPMIAGLQEDFGFLIWRRYDEERDVARFVCSWATTDADVDRLVARARDAVGVERGP